MGIVIIGVVSVGLLICTLTWSLVAESNSEKRRLLVS
jgi:hypothetical protein